MKKSSGRATSGRRARSSATCSPTVRARSEHDARPRRGRQPAVAGEQPAALGPGLPRHGGIGDVGEERGVEPREPQPPGEAPEHRVAGKAQLPHGRDSSVLACPGMRLAPGQPRRCS